MKHDEIFAQWTKQLEQWIATLPKPHPEREQPSKPPIYKTAEEE